MSTEVIFYNVVCAYCNSVTEVEESSVGVCFNCGAELSSGEEL